MKQEPVKPKFPTMLRKMWSGSEVQQWLDEQDLFTTPQPTKQEASEPVYMARRKGLNDFFTCDKERYEELSAKAVFETRICYTTPQPTPTVQSAVAAAYRKAAEVCQIVMQAKFEGGTAYDALEAILAIPHDDSALRETCNAIIEETLDTTGWAAQVKNNEIIDRVLGEKK